MRRHLVTFFVVSLSIAQAYGQFSKPYSSRWQTRFSVGVNVPIQKLLKGDVTDNLLGYEDHNAYFQIFTTSLFFKKHWGLDIRLQSNMSSQNNDKKDNFARAMQAEYGDAYYITSSLRGTIGSDMFRGYLGVVYRFESERFLVYPMFSIGVMSFNTYAATVHLKERNANNIVQVTYENAGSSGSPFILAPSVTIGYRLMNRVAVHVDLASSYFSTDVGFTKQTKDLYTQAASTEISVNKQHVFSFSLGAGLILTIFEKNGRPDK
jgi:hypothetical protein